MVMLDSAGCRDEPVHRLPLTSRVFVTEFSPFQWSSRWGNLVEEMSM